MVEKAYLIGVDLGTSGTKAALYRCRAKARATHFEIDNPHPQIDCDRDRLLIGGEEFEL